MSLEATIKISHEARDALLALGRKGESYDAVIQRLILDHELLKDYVARIKTLELKLYQMEAED